MLRDFSKEPLDIIIQAGQSNSEGYGFGPTDDPYEPNDKVLYLNRDLSISQACERVRGNEIQSNFGLPFAREYVKSGLLGEGRKLLILRIAEGGTSFTEKHWGMQDHLYLEMMEMIDTALHLNPQNRLVALLWHQGESDAGKVSYEVHYSNLMTLLMSVRKTFDAEAVPFIAADFVHCWKNANIDVATPITNAIRAVCSDCGNGGFVETDGLLSNSEELSYNPLGWKDEIHFSRKSIYKLGKRYFDCYQQILETVNNK